MRFIYNYELDKISSFKYRCDRILRTIQNKAQGTQLKFWRIMAVSNLLYDWGLDIKKLCLQTYPGCTVVDVGLKLRGGKMNDDIIKQI